MISGRDIVLISSVEWGFLWQIPQEVSLRLARAGNRVLYVENTGVRSPSLQDAGRVAQRLGRWADSLLSHGVRSVAPGVSVVSPLVLPPFGPRWRRLVNRALLRQQVARAARRLGMRDPVLWTFLPTDTALDIIRLLATPRGVTLYHCTADFSQLTPHARGLSRSEEEVLKLCDLVFANCTRLAELCGRWNDNVHVLPPGVDLGAFAAEEGGDEGEHARRPVIGYVGGLHKHVDFELLAALARARPEWSFVLVGPQQASVNGLGALPNVRLTGQRPHGELARHVRAMDVCIVPYLNNAATETVVPVKLNEYLAAGKPVVSTAIPAVREFNERHGVLITSDGRPDSFLEALERALGSAGDERMIARRREVAALSEWQSRLDAMSDLIEAAGSRKSAGRPASLTAATPGPAGAASAGKV
ncbi:MAG TPA: glycosyltransferase [Pyrinomonadaceae bacterium]|jgi:glycosyltransferase involved in cell wall biosynthesis|nr:glycosyltransferase [Pyrinomonadaceae bacterium]